MLNIILSIRILQVTLLIIFFGTSMELTKNYAFDFLLKNFSLFKIFLTFDNLIYRNIK